MPWMRQPSPSGRIVRPATGSGSPSATDCARLHASLLKNHERVEINVANESVA